MKCIRFSCCILIAFSFIFALEPAKVSSEPLPTFRGDEVVNRSNPVIPSLGNRQSPGDSIGTTWREGQTAGSGHGQRLFVDTYNNIHINWMWKDEFWPPNLRYCRWNFRYSDGTYFGETQASPSISGFVQLDVTRDGSERTIIAYHYDAGTGYFSWIDIDAANGAGHWPNDPKPLGIPDRIWPFICCAENGNIIMATGDYDFDIQHLHVTPDEGNTWTGIADFDSCGTLSQFLRSSHNSNKVVFVHTQYITDQPNVQLDNDVYYMLSTDGGVTWGPHTNITNYQTTDTVRAYSNVNAVFDHNDNLHIAWAGRRCIYPDMWEASKIFHWDEVNDIITIVSSPSIYYPEPGGWWIGFWPSPGGYPGAWRMPADQPQLVADPNGNLYCLWHGNDDYSDTCDVGYFNGELYGSKSTDNGLTWSTYTNLTNTRTPGAGPGDCHDEDYMTAHPYVVHDSIYVTYNEDKHGGNARYLEGLWTNNPVRCWVFHKDLIPGIKEKISLETAYTTPMLDVYPNPFRDKAEIRWHVTDNRLLIKIFDASGQLVKQFDQATIRLSDQITWQGDEPPGVYFVQLESDNYCTCEKVVKLR